MTVRLAYRNAMMTTTSSRITRLVASTGNDYNEPTSHRENCHHFSDSDSSSTSSLKGRDTHYGFDTKNLRSLSLSADGTSLVTTSADRTLRTFILPPDLLESSSSSSSSSSADDSHSSAHPLKPYSSHQHPSSIHAAASSPYYDIAAPETSLILTSPSCLPIRLISPFAAGILATYPLVNEGTEKWITPHSLLFSVPYRTVTSEGYSSGNSLKFLAGSQNQISLFDVNRDGDGPISIFPTAPSNRKARRGGTNGMAGIVSAMDISCNGILAAGTFSRGVGIYDSQGMGDTVGAWSLVGNEDGSGVTSLHWSRCGRYLVIAERQSDALGVWDIRGTGKRLARLTGRNAATSQRLGVALGRDTFSPDNESIYAGGIDGCVRIWSNLGTREGVLESDWHWRVHEDVVSGIAVHGCGSVVATCSGSRLSADCEPRESGTDGTGSQTSLDEDSPLPEYIKRQDNSVRVWSLE